MKNGFYTFKHGFLQFKYGLARSRTSFDPYWFFNMLRKTVRCVTSATDNSGSTTEHNGILRVTTVTSGISP